MITNPYVLSLHNEKFLEMSPRKDPSHVEKRVATTKVSDAGLAQAETQREQTSSIITIEEFRMMREEMRELRIKNLTLRKGMAKEVL